MILHKSIQYSLDNKNITILEKMSIYQIYNQMKQDFFNDGLLIIHGFPILMSGATGQYKMINGWTMTDSRNII